MSSHRGLRVVAGIEAAKGLLILLAGFGVLGLIHHDVRHVAEELVRHSHLNPASRYPRIFVHAASEVTDARLWFLAAAAALYASLRFVEAYGLWRRRRWAEWFGVLTGGVYLPIEIFELLKGVTTTKILFVTLNLVVVVYLGWSLRRSKHVVLAPSPARPAGGP